MTTCSLIPRASMRRVARALVAAAAALATAACTAHPRPGLGHGVAHGWNQVVGGHTSTEETTLVPSEGVMDVEVDSFAGDIVIRADDRLETATIDVIRRGEHGFGRREESTDSLSLIAVAYGVEDRPSGKTIVVKATTTAPEPWFQRADITLTLPRLGSAIVRTSRGHVYVTDFADGVDIETTKGDVRVVSNFRLAQPSTILNSEGSIDWRVASGSAAKIEAEAVNGEVHVRSREGTWLAVDPRNDHDSLYGTINGGTNLVVLRTVGGDIHVYIGPHPGHTGSFTN